MDSASVTTLPYSANSLNGHRLAKPSEEISNSVSPASMSGRSAAISTFFFYKAKKTFPHHRKGVSFGLERRRLLYGAAAVSKTSKEMNV